MNAITWILLFAICLAFVATVVEKTQTNQYNFANAVKWKIKEIQRETRAGDASDWSGGTPLGDDNNIDSSYLQRVSVQ